VPHDREAKTDATITRTLRIVQLHELRKDAILVLRGDTHTGILHGEENIRARLTIGNRDASLRRIPHGVAQ
jgi:hypothetical protein